MYIFEVDIFGLHISPTWYGLMYAISFAVAFFFIRKQFTEKQTDTIFFACILGVILGGRLGYVFFYNFPYYMGNPMEILMTWKGGMSFHGGAIGVILALYYSARMLRLSFLGVADRVVWIVPIGLFFGRIGNYINGELLGMPGYNGLFARIVNGVSYFPTPLLEAFFEGIILLLILIAKKNRIAYPGQVGVWFLGWYGIFRFIAEFFRTPDVQVGYLFGTNWFTLGHLFSIGMILVAIILNFILGKKLSVPVIPAK